MIAWRIAKQEYALDRTGAGALACAGRWHANGVPVIYAGLSVEICTFEKLVLSGPILPKDLLLAKLVLPDDPALYEAAEVTALPGWDASPPGRPSIDYGTQLLRSGRRLGLIVPSAVIPEARILVINPLHPRFASVALAVERPFSFDTRLRSKP
ncbi:MAG: RES family NAD+ phosphorylase [Rhodocyclaceae bacterium]|nr:RES family NAD+ phosphorylase [Rhodocyclaceae bacterium]MBX3669937.1 RES family NAD+ phosphorylase [Rhodocyclaceae bacterium]